MERVTWAESTACMQGLELRHTGPLGKGQAAQGSQGFEKATGGMGAADICVKGGTLCTSVRGKGLSPSSQHRARRGDSTEGSTLRLMSSQASGRFCSSDGHQPCPLSLVSGQPQV